MPIPVIAATTDAEPDRPSWTLVPTGAGDGRKSSFFTSDRSSDGIGASIAIRTATLCPAGPARADRYDTSASRAAAGMQRCSTHSPGRSVSGITMTPSTPSLA